MATFYDTHKNAGVLSAAIPAISIMIIVDTIGIIANSLVIMITIFAMSLRSTTNYLLAMQCFFDSIHVLAHYYLAYVLYSGKNFDTLPTCFFIMAVPLTGLSIGMSLIFFTAVDRLFAVLLPSKHQKLNKVLYLGSILAICMGYNVYILYIGYLNAKQHKDTMVICLIIEGLHGTPSTVWSAIATGLVFTAVFIYIIIGICIHRKFNSNVNTRKLYKSLFILCILMTFSWVLSCVNGILSSVFNLSEELAFFIPLYVGITINVACGSNFFILTRYSKEYRIAAKDFFERIGIQGVFKPASKTFPWM
ncbi:hypothetical protein FO519_003118 [Halicephalobus sp. NKZ332]|nr:hypothetical protein FO519_003118 [Halicephalobus sp. NKZ332]